ncbi:MAG: protein-methionine-sulfoxide reductase catalytic subunit MsrP [Saccharospirillum sp.]|nr:protein-methionine-sulfoxide reductase catalytic subunit MsrP [Saccharospirillum sp.]
MIIRQRPELNENDVTPKASYLNRRQLIQAAAGVSLVGMAPAISAQAENVPGWLSEQIRTASSGLEDTSQGITDWDDATQYNNFYEFGTGKSDPARNSGGFNPHPWEIEVDGLCANPGTLSLEDMLNSRQLEERIYRLRCVEAWSMVIPWTGIELAKLLQQFEPTSDAKYVAFQTVYRPSEMRGQRSFFSFIDYPYVEGLRMDEAMHPLSFMAVGMYGEALPNQNGAPIRLVTPWKYGFKWIKSIDKITFTDEEPPTTWNLSAPREYGFYANVNPEVHHPRWSQATERRIGPNGNIERIPTEMFNGYDEVASLYQGMDLSRFF